MTAGIPLALLYYLYLAFILVFLLFTLFNLYHLVRFGFLTIGNIVMIGAFLLGTIAMLLLSWQYISQIDWTATIPIIQLGVPGI